MDAEIMRLLRYQLGHHRAGFVATVGGCLKAAHRCGALSTTDEAVRHPCLALWRALQRPGCPVHVYVCEPVAAYVLEQTVRGMYQMPLLEPLELPEVSE